MINKKKICAGCNGLTYIYKNIDGKKYCKSCTFKLQPQKPIKKLSEKGKFRLVLKKDLVTQDKLFYEECWDYRFNRLINPYCECCGTTLSLTPNMMYFHHILEKRNYPQLRHTKQNIAIICTDCHSSYETNPDNVPYLVRLREKKLIEFKKIIQNE